MSKFEYVAIAAVINAERVSWDTPGGSEYDIIPALVAIESTAESLAGVFSALDPSFCRDTFLSACGIGLTSANPPVY